MMQLEWTTVALQTSIRSDDSDVVIRWRKHQPVGRMISTHAVDVRISNGRCCIHDQRGLTEAQAEYWFDRKLHELSSGGYTTTEATHAALGVH